MCSEGCKNSPAHTYNIISECENFFHMDRNMKYLSNLIFGKL